ncbi:MAG: alkaline phosphatase [Lachnospiraceae bacterium]
MKLRSRILALLMCIVTIGGVFAGCGTTKSSNETQNTESTVTTQEVSDSTTTENVESTIPKYVFLFIGDGMSYTQIQAASYYLGAVESNGGIVSNKLGFMDFPVSGSAQTYDSTSFAPDSASTATSIATGNKTYSGTINMDTSFTVAFETISEKLKKQKDYKVGIVSSVNLNHATPAAFYGHNESRNNYYDLGLELIASNFDYFAGGALLQPKGKEEDKEDLYELAKAAGYAITTTQDEFDQISAGDKVIAISETLADGNAMSYEMDAVDGEYVLKDYVKKGIEVLENETGFFMMVEGGKIDWAGHANDAGATMNDTIAFSNAVDVAIEFYNKYPEDTLILVTGDHETGGLSIGFAGTNYDTYFTNFENQVISYAKFNTDYVAGYKENNTPFADVLVDIKANFGLMTSDDADATEDSTLVLTDYELERIETAYKRTLSGESAESQEDYVLYGTYDPLTVTVTHILNNKSGISFTSYAHTGLPVPVFAMGTGEDVFTGYYDNTDIYHKLATLTGVQ